MTDIVSQIVQHLGDIKTPLALAAVALGVAGAIILEMTRQKPDRSVALAIVWSLFGLCALAFVLAAIPWITQAFAANFSVSGSVSEDSAGKAPIPGARVVIRSDSFPARSAASDGDGNFAFSLPKGAENRAFEFTVTQDGYVPYDNNLQIHVDENFQILLRRVGDVPPSPPSTPQNLSISGSVYEDSPGKAPVPGAHVVVRSISYPTRSAASDTDGNFSFSVPRVAEGKEFELIVTNDRYQPFDKNVVASATANLLVPLERLINPAQVQQGSAKIVSIASIAREVKPVLPPAILESRVQSSTRPGQVTSFQWTYQFANPPQRQWTMTSNGHWDEYYGDDHTHAVSSFSTEAAGVVDGCPGTVLRRDDATLLEAFVPDRGCKLMWARFRSADGNWQFLGQMQNIAYAS